MAFSRLHPRRGRSKKEWARYWHICKISRQQEKRDGITATESKDASNSPAGNSAAPPSQPSGAGTQDHSRQADGVAGEEVTADLDAVFLEVTGVTGRRE